MSGFPEGAEIAAVSSWDGGTIHDLRMAEVLDQYGWRGTFFVEAAKVGDEGYLGAQGLSSLLKGGHDIGLLCTPDSDVPAETAKLQAIVGRPISIVAGAGVAPVGMWLRSDEGADIVLSKLADRVLPVTAPALEDHNRLRELWDNIESSGDGVFHLWGRAADLGDDDDAWADLECNLAWFCGKTEVWYSTPDELVRQIR